MQTTKTKSDQTSTLVPRPGTTLRTRSFRARSASNQTENPPGPRTLSIALIDENFRRATGLARQAELTGTALHVYWSADALSALGATELTQIGAVILSRTARAELAMMVDPAVKNLLSSIQVIILEDRPAASSADSTPGMISFGPDDSAARIIDAAVRLAGNVARRDA
jgi:hypothetical protein